MSRFCIALLVLLLSAPAAAAVDPQAGIVQLRQDCGMLDDCFSSVTALNDWIANTRMPGSAAPLLVEIGPGTFSGPFQCRDVSHITLRGAGRSNTTLVGDKAFLPNNVLFAPAFVLVDCDRLNVEAMNISGEYGAIWWEGSGETTWTGVDVAGTGRAWYEKMNCDAAATRHSWFNSRLTSTPYATSNVTYSSFCGETWLYNTTLTALSAQVGANGYSWGDTRALWIQGGAAQVIGGTLANRARIAPSPTGSSVLEAVRATTGKATINGALIVVESDVAHPVEVLVAETGGALEVTSTAYRLDAGGDIVTRIDARGGSIDAGYAWGSRSEPPAIVSVTGADTYIETDCDALGCQVTGDEPHTLIYDSGCSAAGPWFDTTVKRCRGL